jgi:hypothetical protein
MNWKKVRDIISVGIYTSVIVLVFDGLLEFFAKDISVNVFSFVGVMVVLATSLFTIGYLVNKIVLYYSDKHKINI